MAFRKRQVRSRECFDDALLGRLADEAPPRLERFDRRQQALLECLRRLRPDQRSMLARRYEPGGSLKDVAAACGRPAKAVCEALRRLRETLMRCIEKRLALEGGR
jgi:RNA polymerase sigma-70 factor (ECF subfamily)